jgi:Protein of unknown function (DUF1634)
MAGRDNLSRWVSGTLQLGALASIGLVAVGLVIGAEGVTGAGLWLLVLTPAGRLVAAIGSFVRSGEARYAAAGTLVLALLVGGLALSLVTRGAGS